MSPRKAHTIPPVKTMEMDKFFLDMYIQAGGLLPSKFLVRRKTNSLIARNIRRYNTELHVFPNIRTIRFQRRGQRRDETGDHTFRALLGAPLPPGLELEVVVFN